MNIFEQAALYESSPDVVEKQAETYFKRYKTQMNLLESSSALSKVRSIGSYDYLALGKQLAVFEGMKKIAEADGTASTLGQVPNVAFDVITATYGGSPISVLASTQVIDEEQGMVYYKSIKASNARGSVSAGDSLFNSVENSNMATGFATNTNTAVAATGDGSETSFSTTLTGLPVFPGTVEFTTDIAGVMAMDDGKGNVLGKGVSGTINYDTGALVLEFATAPANGETMNTNHRTEHSGSEEPPTVAGTLQALPIRAKQFALRSVMGLDKSYALTKRFGIGAEDMFAEDLTTAINIEIMGEALVQLGVAGAQAQVTWDAQAPMGVSYYDHRISFKDALKDADVKIVGNAGRGSANNIIAGRAAAGVISTLPGFVKVTDGSQTGPHIFGTLDGVPVIRVPADNLLASNKVLVLYRGSNPFDAGLVYSPYMPLTVTGMMANGNNPLAQQRAAMIWAGVDCIIPQFVSEINITNL